MPRITKTIEERRREILDTAREMFIENGYDKTQVADISKRMNVASGLIFHYYKTKAELLYAVIDELAEERKRELHSILEKSDESALDRLKMFFPSPEFLNRYEVLYNSLAADKAIIEYCQQKLITINLPLLCALIEEGNKDGSWDCGNIEETATFILHGLSGLTTLLRETARYTDEMVKIAASVIFRILGLHKEE
jgi:AcrR family transcriptional regulator